MMNRFVLLCLLSSAIASFSTAQYGEKWIEYKTKFTGNNIALSLHSERITIDMVEGVPVVKTNSRNEYVLLNQNGVSTMGQGEISFSSFDIVDKVDAYAMIPNGKGYKKVKATNFNTKDAEAEGSVFHDDEKITTFLYPSLCEGSFRVLDYTSTSTENRFPFGFNFSTFIPVDQSEFIIDCDSSIHINKRIYNDEIGAVNYREEIIKGRRIMVWTISNPPVLKSDERATHMRYYSSHVLAQISHYNTNNGRVDVLETPDDLHNWYKTNIQNVLNEVPSKELVQITDSIVKGISDEQQKVKAVYYWVQSNIKYIAFEEGINGLVPRLPSSIYAKRYGDCKDIASLIYSMLKIAKIPSYLTWIGTRDLPYKYSEFPSKACDNHMILTYFEHDKAHFLDATCSFLPFGFPSYAIQGKEGFVHISDSEYKIVDVPIMSKEDTYWRDTSEIRFEGQKIVGTNKTLAAGYYNVFINDLYRNVAQSKLNEFVQNMHQKGNNTFKIMESSIENGGDREENLKIAYDFEINNYVTSYENEVYVNMVLDKKITQGEMKVDRIAPFQLENYSNDNYTVILDVPGDYFVKTVPKDVTFQSEKVDYSVQYRDENEKIIMTVKLNLKFLTLYPDSFAKWNEFVKVMKNSMMETVVLQKK